ncbi:MAG: hypothetical protein ABGX08_02670 [Citromicrobium sp.]
MIWTLIAIGYVAVSAFNLWAINTSWKREFGHVTRGEFLANTIISIVPLAGLGIALISLATLKWPNAWSRFWNKDVL